ncbi:autotransporter outer membrane beta-barrel domain-containing protein [Pseudomonas fragi]|uniref:autotransporter outer membrane beta-barrel domain-containing protein n=1 Tax=Pseudomonas fragi TaxID=296 RepID=UPI0016BD4BA2|nr:autotransporter outer membrane beta-barrel domain-containing protein [Pseudomonas fragi]NNB06636.1 autotransporter outer membrane beta-barrel domain-containing protein [Pseudomonas fragi]
MKSKKSKLSLSIAAVAFVMGTPEVSATVFARVNATEDQTLAIGSGDSVVYTPSFGNAVFASGLNALVTATDTTINTLGNNNNAVNASAGGVVNLKNVEVDVKGVSSFGLTSQTGGTVNADQIIINTSGENSSGIRGAGGALNLNNVEVNTSGFKSYGLLSDVASSTISFTNGNITTLGDQSSGVTVEAGNVELKNTNIETYGEQARGVNIAGSGHVTASNLNIISNGDNRSDGIVSSGMFTGDNINISAQGLNSYAVTMAESGKVNLSNSQVGSNNSAINFTAQATRSGATVELENTNIKAINNIFIAGNSVGHVYMTDTTTNSATHQFASALNNAALDIMATNNTLIEGALTADSTSSISLSLENNSHWSGYSKNATNISLDDSSSWVLTGSSDVKNLVNAGEVSLNGAPGTILTVTGDYHGNNGLLNFNTVLNDDASATDKLVVNGNTSGTTLVSVTNIGGSGMATLNGIEMIQVNGISDGDFIKSGRIVAGAYDYSLVRGINANASNWYLTNELIPNPNPETDHSISPFVERPEAGAYTANLAAANNMFVTRLHDRLGETEYIDLLTGEQKVTSMWLRNEGGYTRSRDGSGQLSTKANRYVMLLGGDIAQWSNNGMDRLHLGVMAGYGNSKSRTTSKYSDYNAKGKTDGYSAGIYGTWYAHEADRTGAYIDGWAQYSWFNNSVNGQDLASENYKSKGVTTSIESGYTFKVGENSAKNSTYFIQPKAQVTWMGVKANDHSELNGTQVSGEGDGNIQTRLGVKAFIKRNMDEDKAMKEVLQPFVEANWIHNTKDFGTTLDNTTVKQDGTANIGELKIGMDGKINKQLNLWGNIAQQVGRKGYSDTGLILGIKYNF